MWLLTFLIVGFLAGLLARVLVSGPGPKGLLRTTALGVAGSFLGGFAGYLLFDEDLESGAIQTSGFIGSVLGAIVILLIYRHRARS